MDVVTLALAKQYTDSQQLAYTDSRMITIDPAKEYEIEQVYGIGFAKISDKYLDPNTITRVVVVINTGASEVFELSKEDITIDWRFNDDEYKSYTAYTMWGGQQIPIFRSYTGATCMLSVIAHSTPNMNAYVDRIETETIHPIDPKYIPALDSLTLNGADGKQYKLAVDESGALAATAIE